MKNLKEYGKVNESEGWELDIDANRSLPGWGEVGGELAKDKHGNLFQMGFNVRLPDNTIGWVDNFNTHQDIICVVRKDDNTYVEVNPGKTEIVDDDGNQWNGED